MQVHDDEDDDTLAAFYVIATQWSAVLILLGRGPGFLHEVAFPWPSLSL